MSENHERPPLLGWLLNAGLDDMTRCLQQMTGTPDDIEALRAALAKERSLPDDRQRVTRIKPLAAKLCSYEPPDPYAQSPRWVELLDAKKSLDQFRGIIAHHETQFLAITLEPRVMIGLHCLKAYTIFAIPDPSKRGAKKGKKSSSRREELSKTEGFSGWQGKKSSSRREELSKTEGFSGWLKREVPWLKEATGYKYMNAIKGLALDHTATEADVSEALAQHRRVGPLNLKILCDMAVERVIPKLPPPAPNHQLEFEFLRGEMHEFAVQAKNILALSEQLKAIPQMHKAACARAYGMLRDLSGTDWAPSDIPDILCEIDPDTIEL